MKTFTKSQSRSNDLRRCGFLRDTDGLVTAETAIILPTLIWALVAMPVFFSAFHSKSQAETAALAVVDLISRNTNTLTFSYLEGMNDVFDELVGGRHPARLRISSVIFDPDLNEPVVQWSYGTRDLPPLPDDTFQRLSAGEIDELLQSFGESDDFDFASGTAQLPTTNLHQRIPGILPGEALILVEAFSLWTPFASAGLGNMRFTPVAVARPRWSPWINLEGAVPTPPTSDYETTVIFPDNDIPPPEDDTQDPAEETPPEDDGSDDGTDFPQVGDDETDDNTNDPQLADGWVYVVSQNFDDGNASGWSAQTITDSGDPATGNFLGLFGGETRQTPVTFPVDLGTQSSSARITFDFYRVDDWNGYDWTSPYWGMTEGFQILVDGHAISHSMFHTDPLTSMRNDRTNRVTRQQGQFDVSFEKLESGQFLGQSSVTDGKWRVTIDIERPVQQFTLGLSAKLNGTVAEKSFAIDNFEITAMPGPHSGSHFIPPASDFRHLDVDTSLFPMYDGCPNPDHTGPGIPLRMSELNSTGMLRFEYRAGGYEDLYYDCGGLPGWGNILGSPTFVLDYDNEGMSGTGNRLRILTDDYNLGRSCDSTLLVRDPHGQWWFNGEIKSIKSWNARIDLGDAASGKYQIWLGKWKDGFCWTEIGVRSY